MFTLYVYIYIYIYIIHTLNLNYSIIQGNNVYIICIIYTYNVNIITLWTVLYTV